VGSGRASRQVRIRGSGLHVSAMECASPHDVRRHLLAACSVAEPLQSGSSLPSGSQPGLCGALLMHCEVRLPHPQRLLLPPPERRLLCVWWWWRLELGGQRCRGPRQPIERHAGLAPRACDRTPTNEPAAPTTLVHAWLCVDAAYPHRHSLSMAHTAQQNIVR